MTLPSFIIFLLIIILGVSLASLFVTHRHKKVSSEIIRRLDDHHHTAVDNIEFLRKRAAQVSKEAEEIRDFFDELKTIKEDDTDISTFIKTSKFTS